MPKTHPRRYRIESLVLEALAPLVTTAAPGGGIVTIRHVTLSKDYGVATVVYTTVGGGDQQTQQFLEEQAWRYRRQLASLLNMRKTPKLVFAPDHEGLAADKLRTFLEKISSDDE